MAHAGRVAVETMDGVGLLTLVGHDDGNAITPAMWRSLHEAVGRLGQDDSVRVLVLTGAGHTAFGTDAAPRPDDHGADGGDAAANEAGRAWRALAAIRQPVIARIRGECSGSGMALALAADIRIAAIDSTFALSPEAALRLDLREPLVQAVGASWARYMMLTGNRLEAPEAEKIGLVHRMIEDAELSDTVADLARQLADMEPELLHRIKTELQPERSTTA